MPDTPLAQIPYPDGTTKVADWDDALLAALLVAEQRLVLSFSTSTARDSAIVAPAAGMAAWLSTPQQLTIYDGTAWRLMWGAGPSWTPAFSGTTLGNGSVSGEWRVANGVVSGMATFVLGSTSAVGANPALFLPVDCHPNHTRYTTVGSAEFHDATGDQVPGIVQLDSASMPTTAGRLRAFNAASTYASQVLLSSSIPFTWTTSDAIRVTFSYLADPAAL